MLKELVLTKPRRWWNVSWLWPVIMRLRESLHLCGEISSRPREHPVITPTDITARRHRDKHGEGNMWLRQIKDSSSSTMKIYPEIYLCGVCARARVCVCVLICACIWSACVSVCIYKDACKCVQMCVYRCTYMSESVCECVTVLLWHVSVYDVCVCMCVCVWVCAYSCMHA